MKCLVCEYRRDGFIDGLNYPVNDATYQGVSMTFNATIPVCDEHLQWVTDEFPETLEPILHKESQP